MFYTHADGYLVTDKDHIKNKIGKGVCLSNDYYNRRGRQYYAHKGKGYDGYFKSRIYIWDVKFEN